MTCRHFGRRNLFIFMIENECYINKRGVPNKRVVSGKFTLDKYPWCHDYSEPQSRTSKLGVIDHLMGADVLGFSAIRLSGYPHPDFSDIRIFRIFGPQSYSLSNRTLKLGVNCE